MNIAWSKDSLQFWPREVPEFIRVDGPGGIKPPLPRRHNSPDLAAQLAAAEKIDTIICSVLDGEPTLRLNAAVAARYSDLLAAGLINLKERTAAKRIWIAAEMLAPSDWITPIRKAAMASGAELIELPNHYPQADPTLLIHTLAGRRLAPSRLPTECGVLLIDAAGAATVGGAESVWLGVLDHASGRANYLQVSPGMTISSAFTAATLTTQGRAILSGDTLRRVPVRSHQLAGEGELTLHVLPPVDEVPGAQACIRCGWCAQVCPTRVAPAWLLEAAQRHDARLAHAGGRDACIECGLCEQICPAHLPLLTAIRTLKN